MEEKNIVYAVVRCYNTSKSVEKHEEIAGIYSTREKAELAKKSVDDFYKMLSEMEEPSEDYEFYDLWVNQQSDLTKYYGSRIIEVEVQ
jgi:hypothetical protein